MCYEKFFYLCQTLKKCEYVMLETLLGTFNVILWVTYVTRCYTLTLPLSEDLHISFYGLYNVVSGNHSVQNSPSGEVGSIVSARPRELHLIILCDMGRLCATSNKSKSI